MVKDDYIAKVAEIPEWVLTKAEFLTIVVSIAGIIVALHHTHFFNRDDAGLSKRMRDVFLTDAFVYLVTLVMGVALFFNAAWLVKIDVIIRPFVLILNVIATVRLYRHYKQVK